MFLLIAFESFVGMVLCIVRHPDLSADNRPVNILVIGRAMDLLRVMRLFSTVREIVRRTRQVSRAVIGPLVVLSASVHVLVYLGMSLY